jgi:hypothetical protein
VQAFNKGVFKLQILEYKDCVIYPTPRLQVESGYWKIQLTIRYKNKVKLFSHDNIFSTKAEAVFHSIGYGKRLIDDGIEFDQT